MDRSTITDEELNTLQWTTLEYYIREENYCNGLIADKTQAGWPASIAAAGMALATLPLAAERAYLPRELTAERVLNKLRFFWSSPQGPELDATGYKGFYYHFLDMKTGRRVWNCELSTVDSAFLLAGALAAATYFDRDSENEHEIRSLADALYRRADWRWALNGGATVTHGWKPETGFLPYRWKGYDVLPTIKNFSQMDLGMLDPYGFKATFNRTFPVEGKDHGWLSPWHFGIDQGPIILMIENYRTGLLWRLMQRCSYIITGLRRAGFKHGWL